MRKPYFNVGASVTVNTRDHSGPPVARAPAPVPFLSEPDQGAGAKVEAQIARIIDENRGPGVR